MRAVRFLCLPLVLSAVPVAGQDRTPASPQPTAATTPAQHPPGVDELIGAVRRAHRPGLPAEGDGTKAAPPIDQFHATLRVTSIRPDQDNIEVDLDARFLMPRFLRYRVEDPGAVLERGWDERGGWARTDEHVIPLEGKDYVSERDEVRKHIRLARQLIGFLDPGTVFAKMTFAGPPHDADLDLGRLGTIPTHVLVGTVDSFPLFAPPAGAEPNPPARLTMWIDAATDRLAGVLVQPLDDKGDPATTGEFFLLQDYPDTARQGVMLPLHLVIYRVSQGRKQPEATVEIRAIDFEPDLTPEKMQRPTA